ncbi:MAG TPA: YciI family protein [Verrucomicrobiae bacterium]|nr:YciI family protein [Verrucomicrobiae bacterium]
MNSSQNEYLLLFKGGDWHSRLPDAEFQQTMSKLSAWFEQLASQGKVKGGQALASEGSILSRKNAMVLSDGPFVETKETIGGYLLVTADSLAEAVALAKTNPSLEYGTQVEVRPVIAECPAMTRMKKLNPEWDFAPAPALAPAEA